MGSVESRLSKVVENVQADDNLYALNHLHCEMETPTSESLPNLANIEDPIDAMGAVIFADEEDYGYFGMFVHSFLFYHTANCFDP